MCQWNRCTPSMSRKLKVHVGGELLEALDAYPVAYKLGDVIILDVGVNQINKGFAEFIGFPLTYSVNVL